MLDRLIDLIVYFIRLFKFWWVIRQWEEGITLRFGIWTGRVMKPGFHFILPFEMDEVHTIDVTPGVEELDPQTIMTKDKIVVVAHALVKYQVVDSEICLIRVAKEMDAVKEFSQGALHTVISETDYLTANVKEIERKAKEQAQKEVDKWGIKIKSVVLKSFGKMSSLRLLNSK